MKRTRDGEESPYAATFEIIEGLSKNAYDTTCASWRLGERRLCSPSFSVADTVRLPNEKDPFSLFAARRKLFDRMLLSNSLEGKQNPTLINTVELVGNENTALFFYNRSGDYAQGSTNPTTQFLHQGEVDAGTGARCFSGDVVAYTPQALVSAPRVCDVQFITYQAEVFSDAESWADAVRANLGCVARWANQLASQPPGLARLSFVAGAAFGLRGKGTKEADLTDGWWRSLQLPLLLHVSPSLQGKLNNKVVLQLQHGVVSLLRICVDLFQSTGSIFHQPYLLNCLVGEFFISPLFVEGFSVILPQVAGSLVSSELRSATKSLQDAIRLFLSFQFSNAAVIDLSSSESDKYKSVLWNAARNGFEVLVHALSTVWLSSKTVPAGGRPNKEVNVVAEQMLEEVADSGAFHSVVQWLQRRQDTSMEQSDVSFFKRLLTPPSLREVRSLYGLTNHTITENLDAMKKTNTPYLTKDAIRFLEALASAAHAELYGGPSRAVKQALEHLEMSPSSYQPEEDVSISAVRIQSVVSSAIHADLTACTASEVRHSGQFGLPLVITAINHYAQGKENSFLHTVKRTSGSEGCSTFLYALVRLQGRFSLFPLIVTEAQEGQGKGGEDETHLRVRAHVLRDGELFPEFVYLGAQMAMDGRPDAWLITEKSTTSLDGSDVLNTKANASLMGKSCPAISHMDLLRRSAAVHASLKELVNKPSREAPRTPALREAATAEAFATPSSLWMDYFATGRPSLQIGLSSLSPASLATLSGVTCGEAIIQELVKDAPFTPAQVEALSVLATHVMAPSVKEPLEREQNFLHLVDGVVGSGKSTVLRASGVVKGKMLSAARKEHFSSLQGSIKESTDSLRQVGAPLHKSTDEELPAEHSEQILQELANILETQTTHFLQLSNGLKCSTTPLLVRCASHAQDEKAEAGDMQDHEEGLEKNMGQVAQEGFARAMKAPLTQQLSHVWKALRHLSEQLARVQQLQQQPPQKDGTSGKPQRRLHVPLAGYTLSTRNIVETLAAAVGKKCDSWSTYLSDHLWPAGDIRDTLGDASAADEEPLASSPPWPTHASPEDHYEAVPMPEATLFSKMETGSAHGWLTVLEQKEKALLAHLAESIHHWAHFLFSCLYDIVVGVTSVSHFGKFTLLSCTPKDVLQEGLLPLLWAYRPSFLLVDDAEYLQDGVLAFLTPANQITLAFSSEMPPWLEKQRHLCGAVVRGLRHDVQKPSAVSTVSLHDPIRCQRPEVSGALLQLCADAPFESFSHLVAPTATTSTSAATEEEEGEEQKPVPPAFPGLVSCSGMEMWTHAVPLKLGPHADLVAAIFVARYLGSYASEFATPNPTVALCTAFADEYTLWNKACAQTPLQVSCVPFDDTVQLPEAEKRADIILVSLSGFTHRLCPPSENKSAEARQRRWNEMLDIASQNSFLDRFQSWLWRVLRRAKIGAVLIGSVELATQIPLLRMFHEYIKQQRLALTNKGTKMTYWVPEDAASAVLALRCPDHHKCRRTASIRVSASKKGCEIFLDGIPRCGLLCLKPYEGCSSYSHACLQPCHLQQTPGASAHEEPHAHCPYPCGKKLDCGHVCHRTCGEECGSCNFVGLRELPCGQRVLCGVGPDQSLKYEFIPHFKKSACGQANVQCEEEVFLPCPRCGTKVFVPCSFYTQYNARLQEALKERNEEAMGGGGVPKHMPGEGVFSITERQCAGCVTLFNRICVKYGFDVLDLPPVHIPLKRANPSEEAEQDEEEDDVASELAVEPGTLPRHLLSAEAQDELRQKFTLAGKMAELRAMKEAGEISSENAAAAASQFVQLKAKYEASKAQQEKEEESYKAELRVTAEEWAQRLRKRLDQQVALNEEVESMIPLLLSNASDEGKRQKEFLFS